MALESGTYVKDLVSTNPPGTDAISQGDDHIRLIKSVLKNSFPSNSNAPIVPDISGNGDKYLQVNSGASATQWVTLDVDALTRRKGEVHRPKFSYAGTDSITITPGIYDMANKGKNVSWDSTLTVTGLSGTDEWVYIYLNDAGISGTTVTASEVIGSTTAPSWEDAKHGWYNGNNRCIFAVYFSGSNLERFFNNDNLVQYYATTVSGSNYEPNSTWTARTLKAPAFSNSSQVTFHARNSVGETAGTAWYARTYTGLGGGASDGHFVCHSETSNEPVDSDHDSNTLQLETDDNQRIEIYANATNQGQYLQVYSAGYYLPHGM